MDDSITLSRRDFLEALDRARKDGMREALRYVDHRQDAVKCPYCATVATLDHVKDKDGRCPFCFRIYPAGTRTHAGNVLR